MAYRSYEINYELCDRLNILGENSFGRSAFVDQLGESVEDAAIAITYKEPNITDGEYTETVYTVANFQAIKNDCLLRFKNRFLTSAAKVTVSPYINNGYSVNCVTSWAEFKSLLQHVVGGTDNRNSLVIIELQNDITQSGYIELATGMNVVIYLNGFAINTDPAASIMFRERAYLESFAIYGGTIKFDATASGDYFLFDTNVALSVPTVRGQRIISFDDYFGISSGSTAMNFDMNSRAIDFRLFYNFYQTIVTIDFNEVSWLNAGSATYGLAYTTDKVAVGFITNTTDLDMPYRYGMSGNIPSNIIHG